jgi:mitochondrial fission protein ELM1
MPSSNHLSKTITDSKRLCIWIFHDAKPGHLIQLEGLINRLSFHKDCDIKWFDVSKYQLSIQNYFSIPEFLKNQAKPDLVMGAGHSTHISVLIAGLKFKAFTTLIMKPSLPSCFFDAVICPKHDGLEDSNRVLSTFGSINKIIPTRSSQELTNKNKNIILIGGPSKHFVFDEAQLINSIQLICQNDTNKVWYLSNSPRTPSSFIPALKKLPLTNLKLYSYTDDSFGQLNEVLKQSAFTWVTPDSMSMLYESLTSGATTAVFDMAFSKVDKPSRIAKQVKLLISEGTVINFKSWQIQKDQTDHMIQSLPLPTLWEAERAALWLLQRLKES